MDSSKNKSTSDYMLQGSQPAPVANMNWDYEAGRPSDEETEADKYFAGVFMQGYNSMDLEPTLPYTQSDNNPPSESFVKFAQSLDRMHEEAMAGLEQAGQDLSTEQQQAKQQEQDHFSNYQLVDRHLAGFLDESSDEEDEEDEDSGPGSHADKHPMDLRARKFAFIDPTTVDQDESGDYNPHAKPAKVVVRRKTVLAPQPTSQATTGSTAVLTEKQIRQEGQQFVLEITLASKPALKHFKVLAAQYGDNWPEDKPLLWDDNNIELEPATSAGHALRARRTTEDGQYDVRYLRNTPAARMCKRCYETGDDCSMRRPDGIYPCEACMECGEQCVMLVQPKRKATCESCRSDKVPCSYAQHPTADHAPPCVRCEQRGYTCIAGPAWDPLRTRIGDDGQPASPRPNLDTAVIKYTRTQKTCAPCRRHGYWCSLVDNKRNPDPPCASCKRYCTPCTFEAVPASESYTKPPVRSLVPKKRKSKQEREDEANAVWIETRLSHPIKFMCSAPDKLTSINCHWCLNANTLYPIYGHGMIKKVRIIDWSNGRGYEEVAGGHVEAGHEASRMCVRCTSDRNNIMTCMHGEFKQIATVPTGEEESPVSRKTEPNELISKLLQMGQNRKFTMPEADAVRKEHLRWCSMCPNAAQWACCNNKTREHVRAERQALDTAAVIRAETTDRGCSLRLCWACKHLYTSFFGGNFSEFAGGLVQDAPEDFYPQGLRADAGLLTKHGLLQQFLGAHRANVAL